MSRKHYEMIAAILNDLRIGAQLSAQGDDDVRRAVLTLANTFETDNSRFDRDRFIAACGYSQIA